VSAKALHDYEATKADELSFTMGQTITDVTIHPDGGWWEGFCNGRKGWFPDNFVEEMPDAAPLPKPAPPPAAAAAAIGAQYAKCTFDYDAVNDDELSLKTGDVLEVTEMEEEGWWTGIFDGKSGVFPSNFVEKCDPPKPAPAASPSTAKKPPVGGMGFGKSMFGPGGVPTLKKKPNSVYIPKAAAPAAAAAPAFTVPTPAVLVPAAKAPAAHAAAADTREVVKVLFDYAPLNEDELGLAQGQFVRVVKKENEGWWEGELEHDSSKRGWFPDNFVGPASAAEVAACNNKGGAAPAKVTKPPVPATAKPPAAKKPPAALKPAASAITAQKPSFSTKSKPPMSVKPALVVAAAPVAAVTGPVEVPKEVTDKLDEAMRLIAILQTQMKTLQGQVSSLTEDLDAERDLKAQLLKIQEKRLKAARP